MVGRHMGGLHDRLIYNLIVHHSLLQVSPPTTFKAPDMATHCETVAAALAPCVGKLPAFYYHFPKLYNDDFPTVALMEALRARCPTIVGAKLSGIGGKGMVSLADVNYCAYSSLLYLG
jgi:dihydrodipicolinate synthase/N-acetylneuraminate lyase